MKLKNIFVISILCLSFTACQSFLEVEDEGRSSIPVFFSDMDGVRAALPEHIVEFTNITIQNFYYIPMLLAICLK